MISPRTQQILEEQRAKRAAEPAEEQHLEQESQAPWATERPEASSALSGGSSTLGFPQPSGEGTQGANVGPTSEQSVGEVQGKKGKLGQLKSLFTVWRGYKADQKLELTEDGLIPYDSVRTALKIRNIAIISAPTVVLVFGALRAMGLQFWDENQDMEMAELLLKAGGLVLGTVYFVIGTMDYFKKRKGVKP